MDDPKRGIQFGAEGLSIPLTAGGSQARAAKCRLGTYYAKNLALSERGRSLFAKGESLKGTELLSLKVDACILAAWLALRDLPLLPLTILHSIKGKHDMQIDCSCPSLPT